MLPIVLVAVRGFLREQSRHHPSVQPLFHVQRLLLRLVGRHVRQVADVRPASGRVLEALRRELHQDAVTVFKFFQLAQVVGVPDGSVHIVEQDAGPARQRS